MSRRMRSLALMAAGLLMAGAVAGCGGPGDPSGNGERKGQAQPPPSRSAQNTGTDPALPAALTSQRLHWGACEATDDSAAPGPEWQCATLKAPLDYAKPEGKTIGVALIRAKSTGGGRDGSLLFNFGGPGGSGVSLLPAFAPRYAKLRERYDLVSFDPRGVGRSEGVRCRDDKAIQAAESVDLTPDTPAEERAYFQDAADFGAGCARQAGKLLGHLSTDDTARDMDLTRQVLGDDRLHYLGVSYGTQLGGVYAHLFPERVGRLVLDAVVDPTTGTVGHALGQTRGFQRALDDYLKATGQNPDRGTQKIAALLKRLDAKPLPTADGRKLTQSLATIGITITLYSKGSWPSLTSALAAAENGDGTELLALADAYNERNSEGHYGSQSHAQRAISCLDDKERPTPAEARKRLGSFRAISPVFGEFMAWDTAGWCHDWPVPGQHATPEVSAPGAAPILVVGNTGDPATPYEGARHMADELGKGVGVELTWKGEGHGAYGSGSACVDSTVEAYLLEGRIPRDGKVCTS
ncbi:alpha/beta hydrolase [Streptomyces sp. NPDC046821]|uniref:alpha/beta hydrolase n=1 Tax=Streptomyces sp. NPDC046821 TaxID=3154702 RepID=UPI0033DB37E9